MKSFDDALPDHAVHDLRVRVRQPAASASVADRHGRPLSAQPRRHIRTTFLRIRRPQADRIDCALRAHRRGLRRPWRRWPAARPGRRTQWHPSALRRGARTNRAVRRQIPPGKSA